MEGDVAVGWEMVIWARCQGGGTVMKAVTGMGGGNRDLKWGRDKVRVEGAGTGAGCQVGGTGTGDGHRDRLRAQVQGLEDGDQEQDAHGGVCVCSMDVPQSLVSPMDMWLSQRALHAP